MFPISGFPVNLSRNTNGDDDDRKVVGVVDLFSERNKPSPSATDHDHHQHVKPNIIVNTAVKKEIIPPDEKPPNSNFHVNSTGLQLANTGSDQSVVDDGVSSDAEDKRAKTTELAQLQVELQRMNAENKKLKGMLTALHMHPVALLQKNHHTENTETEVVEAKAEEKNQLGVGGGMVPRQFLEIGPSGTAEVDDRVSNSSSDERTQSNAPQNNHIEAGTRDHVIGNNNGKTELGREERPDSESQGGWGPNEVQKLNPPNTPNQSTTEATMRKARVSVRARSEAALSRSMSDLQQKLEALKGLVGVINSTIDGETQNESHASPPNHNPTSMPGRNRSSGEYNNSGKQTIIGLTNQTGFTKGNANGAINYGDLHVHYNSTTIFLDRN